MQPTPLGVQPDDRSCGAACLVVARALADPAYAAWVDADPRRWRTEVLATHRTVTGLRDHGRWAAPWPRLLGTPPWALARRLALTDGRPRRTRWRPDLAEVRRVVAGGTPVALFVGSRTLPRHVLLAVGPDGDDVRVYDPARGTTLPLAAALAAGWPRVWCAISPR